MSESSVTFPVENQTSVCIVPVTRWIDQRKSCSWKFTCFHKSELQLSYLCFKSWTRNLCSSICNDPI